MEHERRVRVSWIKWEMISSTSSCGSLVIGDGWRVWISVVSPKSNRLILVTPRHQTLAASNSIPIVVVVPNV